MIFAKMQTSLVSTYWFIWPNLIFQLWKNRWWTIAIIMLSC